MRKAARRDTNETEICTALIAAGASVQRLSAKGVPDLLVGFRGETYLLETKQRNGKLTPDQVDWHENWRGYPVAIVRTVDEALRTIGAI